MRTSDRIARHLARAENRAPKHRVFTRKGSRIRTYCGLSSSVMQKMGMPLDLAEDFGSVTCGECNRVSTAMGDLS